MLPFLQDPADRVIATVGGALVLAYVFFVFVAPECHSAWHIEGTQLMLMNPWTFISLLEDLLYARDYDILGLQRQKRHRSVQGPLPPWQSQPQEQE